MTREELRDYVDEQRLLGSIPYHVYSTLIDEIDTLEQEPKTGHWIPCTPETMPEENGRYIVQDKDGRMAIGTLNGFGFMFGHYMNDLVAYCKAPEPYEDKE